MESLVETELPYAGKLDINFLILKQPGAITLGTSTIMHIIPSSIESPMIKYLTLN